ncbi:MAG TPA: flagellar hook-associated protein FlgK, partial [Spongiibacteraceae bacterium]|nr:flagellar hook-associated protein FlgK [Spongiibacteraceae bacterium]
MANLIQIGVSGLLSSQTSLTVTGNNISNANIPSYTRQRAELSTRPEQFTGAGYVGAGSQVSGITRQVEQFILTQIRMDTASYGALNGYANNIGQLDSLLADELSALSPGIESLFASLQTGAEDPTSVPARQLVIADLQSLSQRFGTLYDRLEQQAGAINDQLITLTQQITALGEGIAELNRAITQSPGTGIGQQPNRLLDERDELIRQLSEIVAVRTTNEASGAISVFIGSGQGLVVGSIANAVEARPSVEDPSQVDIFFKGGSSNLKITGLLTGGEVGGLLDFRTETLNPAFNALGRIALAMAGELNAQQRRGLDLEGQFGRNLFTDINDPAVAAQRVIADSSNALPDNRVARVVIDDLNQLTTSDYTLLLTDPTSNGLLDYQMIRRSDNTVVAS